MATTERPERPAHRRGVGAGPTLAIWASCLLGGVAFGLLTDRDALSPDPPEVEPTTDAAPATSGPTIREPAGAGSGRGVPPSSTTTTASAVPLLPSPLPVVLPDVLAGEERPRSGAGQRAAPAPHAASTTTTTRSRATTTTTATTGPEPTTTSTAAPTTTTAATLLPGVPISRSR